MTKTVPIAVKKLRGTYRRDRDPERGLRPDVPGRMWPAPDYLDDRARAVWLRLGGELRRAGLLTEFDRDMFAVLCAHVGRWAAIQDELRGAALVSDGYKHPLLTESRSLAESIRKMASEFGITPAARARALAVAGGEGGAEQLSLADMLFAAVEVDEDDDPAS